MGALVFQEKEVSIHKDPESLEKRQSESVNTL